MLISSSHLSCPQPNWRCIRNGQRRHARSYLEVSKSRSIFPLLIHLRHGARSTSAQYCRLSLYCQRWAALATSITISTPSRSCGVLWGSLALSLPHVNHPHATIASLSRRMTRSQTVHNVVGCRVTFYHTYLQLLASLDNMKLTKQTGTTGIPALS